MSDKLIIFDTTLRDGEQSPGASMTKDEKVRIAKALERMRVDVIEAGFPIASQGDFEAVKAVADVVQDSTICGLARALDKDIDRAGEALKSANSARIHTFIATSPIHMQEIEDSHCDYLALGHHHAALELLSDDAFAAYCGSPTDTIGKGATYIVVDLEKDKAPELKLHIIS